MCSRVKVFNCLLAHFALDSGCRNNHTCNFIKIQVFIKNEWWTLAFAHRARALGSLSPNGMRWRWTPRRWLWPSEGRALLTHSSWCPGASWHPLPVNVQLITTQGCTRCIIAAFLMLFVLSNSLKSKKKKESMKLNTANVYFRVLLPPNDCWV